MFNTPYSDYLHQVHSEEYPVGHLGQGSFYSVMRCTEWYDECLQPMTPSKVHDFAMVWQQCADHRLVQIVETLYMAGLLSPVMFVGTYDNKVSFLISSKLRNKTDAFESLHYGEKITDICRLLMDKKTKVTIGTYERTPVWPEHPCNLAGIIPASPERVSIYLKISTLCGSKGSKISPLHLSQASDKHPSQPLAGVFIPSYCHRRLYSCE